MTSRASPLRRVVALMQQNGAVPLVHPIPRAFAGWGPAAVLARRRNRCNSRLVAEWRHIQSIHETGALRNPDTVVGRLLPARRRWRCAWLRDEALAALRTDPFYYYLVARTKHYDALFAAAIADGFARIVNVGCGSDTRVHRFADRLLDHRVQVLECDRAVEIAEKSRRMRRWPRHRVVAYAPIDLNDAAWPALEAWLGATAAKTLVIMEGVSPYVEREAFDRFLRFLAARLPSDSRVAYDFKFRGVADGFGSVEPGRELFRLDRTRHEIVAYHEGCGFAVDHVEESDRLQRRLLPATAGAPFSEDGLVQVTAGRNTSSRGHAPAHRDAERDDAAAGEGRRGLATFVDRSEAR